MIVVGRFNLFFFCIVYLIGSLVEGIKIGDFVEFDFVFCLDNFLKFCILCLDDEILNSGFVCLEVIFNFCEVL